MDRTLERVSLIADDLGRLRRMGVDHYALERLCHHVDSLDGLLRPTAAERWRLGVPVVECLRQVDAERREILLRMALDNVG